MSIFRDYQAAAARNSAPGTVGLVSGIVIVSVIAWLTNNSIGFIQNFVVAPAQFGIRPWTLLTYPFLNSQTICMVLMCMWLWGIGGSVEKDLGTPKYLGVFFTVAILSGLGLLVGAAVTQQFGLLAGAYVPVSAITIIWGTRHPNDHVLLMFIIPIAGKYLAWLSAALVLFATTPALAPFAALPLVLAYLFAANKLPFAPYSAGGPLSAASRNKVSRNRERHDKAYMEDVKRREKNREEQERLRKLFESSLIEDPEKD